jgi:hypothetical protein
MNTTQVREKIREHMPVVCSESEQFGTVDRVEGDQLKLTRDKEGQHHYFPLAWVTRVDDKVHVDRPGREVMKQWSTAPPTGAPR